MPRLRHRPIALLLTAALWALAACGAPRQTDEASAAADAVAAPDDRPMLGLMTSLPLYWPLGAEIADLAAPDAAVPWQRRLLARRHDLQPLDTLSPIPALSPGVPEVDPLARVERLAVIQPRGLSPADNVALDDWVRGGGRLLLVLDPVLTGDYGLPLGDPRRPVDTALTPPVVGRWGLDIFYPVLDDPAALPASSRLPAGGTVPLAVPGMIDLASEAATSCESMPGNALVTCRIGKGRVTLLADAGVFEHPELAGEGGANLAALLAAAFD